MKFDISLYINENTILDTKNEIYFKSNVLLIKYSFSCCFFIIILIPGYKFRGNIHFLFRKDFFSEYKSTELLINL